MIGRYKLLEKIGEGGFGTVYVAEQREPVKRRVALKIIKLGMDTKQVIARFEAERQALALMDHPNIAKVLEAAATDTGRPYFVMELVRGIRITDYCDQNNLQARQRLNLFISVCQAIQHAHQKGIIHRDIKPSNILVTLHDGVPVPKVIDFGIAKATQGELTDKTVYTQLQEFIGTPAYMSPEQAEMSGLDIDTRADIYSLGVLLYELLTGKTPFDAKELLASGIEAMRKTIREKEPVRPSTRLTQALVAAEVTRRTSGVPEESASSRRRLQELVQQLRGDLDWIAMKCLEKDRTRRYDTANGLASDVQRYLNTEPVTARPPSQLYRVQKMVRRNKLAFAAASAVAAALVIGLGLSSWLFVKERGTRQRAETAEREQARQRLQAEAEGKKARSEAAKSQQVARFLQDMLKSVGPSVALGRDTTMLQEILDKTAERIGNDLTNQPEVEAELRTTIGLVYNELEEFSKAEGMHRKALALRKRVLGNEHPAVADSLYNLAVALRGRSPYIGAVGMPMVEEALALYRKLQGSESLEVAKCLSELGNWLCMRGMVSEAEANARQALEIQTRLLGHENADSARSLRRLGTILMAEGKLSEAESRIREAWEVSKRLVGPNHPDVLFSLHWLGQILLQEGQLAESEAVSRDAVSLGTTLFGAGSRWVGESLADLITLLRQQGKETEAAALLGEALARLRKSCGDRPEKMGDAISWLMGPVFSSGKQAEVEELLNEVLTPRLASELRGEALLCDRATLRSREGRWREAVADLSKVLEFEPENHGYYALLALLLVESGDREGYTRLCAQIRARFGGTTNDAFMAAQMAQACLLLPSQGADLRIENFLADVAVTVGRDNYWAKPEFQFCKGLAEYRQGHLGRVEDWMRKSLAGAGTNSWDYGVEVEAYMVLAMAQCRLQRVNDARASLVKGVEIEQTRLPKLESGDIGENWPDWIFAHLLMREAKALIEGSGKAGDGTKTSGPSAPRKESP